MSHKHSFQCFSAIDGEGSHKSSHPLKHHTFRLPRIPQHGMVAHHEPLEECYLCSDYRHAQALEALETPLYHGQSYHHQHPHQYVLRRPARPEEPPMAHSGCHIHHHRYNKRVVLVKNSDPSFQKTIVLRRRTLQSFGLFLEEVSELMHYNIRKLYTLEGSKIDSVQSLMQCPSVLVCVGREPSHPSVLEILRKSSDDKLPKLNGKSPTTGCAEGQEVNGGLTRKKKIIYPKMESDNRSTKHSVSSDKSLPDVTYSPDHVDSCSHTAEGMMDDGVEKLVHFNKDGSLSMEMKSLPGV
ncbi:hypothetical protein LDENG_00133670 [Lucifuga dentata]|nr:hypothetical protein LDENG_00133670 [Lucifuga dentata]